MKKFVKLPKKLITSLLVFTLLTTTLASCGSKDDVVENTAAPVESEEVQEDIVEVSGEYPLAVEELGSGDIKWSESETADGWVKVINEGGVELGYSLESGVELIQVNGFAFKDMNRNGMLDGYEDWRQEMEVRSADIASMLTIEDVAGLMLYSGHQSDVSKDLTDEQKDFLDMGLRAVLSAASVSPTKDQAEWANAMQAYAETKSILGIPVNISTDPRSEGVSVWPDNLAISATFDTELAFAAAKQLSKEYRALGIGTYLGPQIDVSSEPRWSRTSGSVGEDPALARDIANALTSGYQSTYDESGNDLGWGNESMNAMIKHWVAEGSAQGGREGHTASGQHSVFPGDNFDAHLIPFVDGGLNLDSITESATAVMSSYSIAWDDDEKYGELVGSSFSEFKINLLRDTYGFDGVICTDWGVATKGGMIDTGWGVEELENSERVYKAVMAGVDQFGGNNDPAPIIEAYQIGINEIGEEAILERFQDSGRRLLKNYFYVGLFDNPYVSVDNAMEVVAGEEAVQAGYEAQLKTITMLKNEGNIISEAVESDEKPTVYVPLQFTPGSKSFLVFLNTNHGTVELPVPMEELEKYYNVVTDTLSETLTGPEDRAGNPTAQPSDIIKATPAELANVDYALVFINNPNRTIFTDGYNEEEDKYYPISLQYGDYVADNEFVRTESIAGPFEITEVPSGYVMQTVKEKIDINYYGEEAVTVNGYDLETVKYAAENVESVIVALNMSKPAIVNEFEADVDSILVGYGVQNSTFLEIATGNVEPYALLPFQIPANMETVEAQFEDVPRDMEVHIDAAGNAYDFAYGMNWSGVIDDERVAKYSVEPITTPAN